MEIFLIIVMLMLPGPNAPKMELQRQLITASSFSSCQAHADKLAEEVRKQNQETLRKQGSTVVARCYSAGTMT